MPIHLVSSQKRFNIHFRHKTRNLSLFDAIKSIACASFTEEFDKHSFYFNKNIPFTREKFISDKQIVHDENKNLDSLNAKKFIKKQHPFYSNISDPGFITMSGYQNVNLNKNYRPSRQTSIRDTASFQEIKKRVHDILIHHNTLSTDPLPEVQAFPLNINRIKNSPAKDRLYMNQATNFVCRKELNNPYDNEQGQHLDKGYSHTSPTQHKPPCTKMFHKKNNDAVFEHASLVYETLRNQQITENIPESTTDSLMRPMLSQKSTSLLKKHLGYQKLPLPFVHRGAFPQCLNESYFIKKNCPS